MCHSADKKTSWQGLKHFQFDFRRKGICFLQCHLHISVSIFLSHLFLYRPNAEESDVLILKDGYIHLHEEYSDDNRLSSAFWLTYFDSYSIQQNRTQRISHCPRYIIMREIQYISGYIG